MSGPRGNGSVGMPSACLIPGSGAGELFRRSAAGRDLDEQYRTVRRIVLDASDVSDLPQLAVQSTVELVDRLAGKGATDQGGPDHRAPTSPTPTPTTTRSIAPTPPASKPPDGSPTTALCRAPRLPA